MDEDGLAEPIRQSTKADVLGLALGNRIDLKSAIEGNDFCRCHKADKHELALRLRTAFALHCTNSEIGAALLVGTHEQC
jgi:hypothetical protein